ncbi:MAG: ABC transporter permease [Acidobacteria bacterium]|nr:MAG: ABC transporter permease [Acidobacteriota bacterium]
MAADGKPEKSRSLRELLPHVWVFVRPRRKLLALGFVLMAINRLAGLVLPSSLKFLFDDIILKRRVQLLGPLVLAVLGATVVQGITDFSLTQLLSKEAQRLITELRRQVQEHVGRLAVSYYDSTKTGALVSRIMSDVEGLRNLIGTGLVQFAGGILTALFALIILLHISVSLTVLALVILATLGVALNRAFGVIRPIFRQRSKINAEVTGRLTESLAGVRVVKGYHAEKSEAKVFAQGAERLLQNVLKTLTATSVMSLASIVLLGGVSSLIMYFGARKILAGSMSPGSFVQYTAFLALLIAPVFQMVGVGTQLTEAMAGLERTRELMEMMPEDEDARRTVALGRLNGEVVFEDVNFAYNAGRDVLHEIAFSARPGTVTALVGPSGAGKSTVIGLISAFYLPSFGRVLVDGVDLATVRLDSYRTQLGVVLQDTFLFDGTIRENVAFSRPHSLEDRILAACRIARVDEFAETLEKKYETVIGERGVKLSGGQKQRVSIARAILADPRILILDEATSSLDSESEALIQEGLAYLMQGRTTFVIAHRLSTIRRADQILVMEAGRIVERGTHDSLLPLRGRYFDLYTKQYGLETNLFLAPGESVSVEEEPSAESVPAAESGNPLSDAVRLLRTKGT